MEVEGPVFYATKYVLDDSVNLREMWVNQEPDESSHIYISDGDFRAFATDSLGIDSFYSARYDFTLFARLDAPEEITSSQKLMLELSVFNEDWEYEQPICPPTLIEIEKGDYSEYYTSCSGNAIEMDEDDIFYWKVSGLHLNDSVKFYIKLDGNTKIEVTSTI